MDAQDPYVVLSAILVSYWIWKQIVRHAVVGNDEVVQVHLWCMAELLWI